MFQCFQYLTFYPTGPEKVTDLSVGQVTTSSVSLEWAKPNGKSSHYRVKWTDGTTIQSKRVAETNVNVTELTAGVQYTFTVIAVAGDNTAESAVAEVSLYTSKELLHCFHCDSAVHQLCDTFTLYLSVP